MKNWFTQWLLIAQCFCASRTYSGTPVVLRNQTPVSVNTMIDQHLLKKYFEENTRGLISGKYINVIPVFAWKNQKGAGVISRVFLNPSVTPVLLHQIKGSQIAEDRKISKANFNFCVFNFCVSMHHYIWVY